MNSLGERIVVEPCGMKLVPEMHVDGECILMTRPVFEEHECKPMSTNWRIFFAGREAA